MISILHGNVISQETDGIIVDVNGVGFHVMVPMLLRDQLQPGENSLFIYKDDYPGRCVALVRV